MAWLFLNLCGFKMFKSILFNVSFYHLCNEWYLVPQLAGKGIQWVYGEAYIMADYEWSSTGPCEGWYTDQFLDSCLACVVQHSLYLLRFHAIKYSACILDFIHYQETHKRVSHGGSSGILQRNRSLIREQATLDGLQNSNPVKSVGIAVPPVQVPSSAVPPPVVNECSKKQ